MNSSFGPIQVQLNLILLLIWNLNICEPTNSISAMYQIAKQRRFDGDIMKILEGTTAIKCAAYSSKYFRLSSFNFMQDNDKASLGKCEIASSSKQLTNEKLKFDAAYSFYQLKKIQPDPCDNNPCKNGGSCKWQSTNDPVDFNCTCLFPTGGKTCEDLDCGGPICTRLNQTVFFMYHDKSEDWAVAKSRCESQGFNMTMPKDQATNEFLQDYFLNTLYPNNLSFPVAYYIGLSRVSIYKPFKWIDGEVLGKYQPWINRGTDNELCVCLASSKSYMFRWDADPCTVANVPNWYFYVFCQKQYPFLEN